MGCGARVRGAAELAPTCVMNFADGAWVCSLDTSCPAHSRGERGYHVRGTSLNVGRPKALEWLDTAMRLRDPGLVELKTDPLMDPLRKEPRFQAIERELKFPQ